EFMAALLTSVMESSDRVPFYIEECRQHKIAVLPPDVNESAESFLVSGNKIRFGLAAIKQVGHNAIQAILEERKNGRFLSLQDFCERVDLSQVNRRVLENLIKCGAFGSVPGTRAQLLEILHLCIDQGLAWQRQKNSNQLSLFDLTSTPASFKPSIPLPEVRDFSEREILQMEKETLGLYLSGHPLAEFMGVIRGKTTHVIEELAQATDGDLVVLAGVITAVRRTVTKRGETMAYFTLEDLSGSVEALLFPKNLAKFNNLLKTDSPVLVKARLNLQEDKPKIFVESISSLTNLEWQVEPGTATTLYLKISPNVDENLIWEELRPIIALYQGKTPLYLYFPHLKKLIKSKPEFWVNVLPQLMVELESLTGVEAISVVNK
ncbi:MAG: OB-fold nucleic acid binding domain-containing protein, partial [Bacillota bacterium]